MAYVARMRGMTINAYDKILVGILGEERPLGKLRR
jgi:hypothetical protein